MNENEKEGVERELLTSFKRWDYLYTNGGCDPFHEDGYNLNLVRNHIMFHKRQLKELEYFPEIYYRDIPPEVDNKYMDRADEIREHARQSLRAYIIDDNYQYIIRHASEIEKKDAEKISLHNILGYVYGLETFLKRDSLVEMRRHENPKGYLESFKDCRKKMEELLKSNKPTELKILEEDSGQLRFV